MIGNSNDPTRTELEPEVDKEVEEVHQTDTHAAQDEAPKNPYLDPKKLFELVSKNYETWSQAMSKQFQEEENFSPFPVDDEGTDGFNCTLLEALEKASNEFSEKINKLDDETIFRGIQKQLISGSKGVHAASDGDISGVEHALHDSTGAAGNTKNTTNGSTTIAYNSNEPLLDSNVSGSSSKSNGADSKAIDTTKSTQENGDSTKVASSNDPSTYPLLNFSLLKQSEIDFLRNRITQMINSNEFTLNTSETKVSSKVKVYPSEPPREGFSLYDTRDEEGLHEGNTDLCYDDENEEHSDDENQDDYDIEEINNDPHYSYNYSPNTHHFEVELNTTPECDVHGFDGCDCPIYESQRSGHNDDEGPACEFTFEYDGTGKLVPVYNNVEEKLRMMSLQSTLDQRKMKLPSIKELNIGPQLDAKKKKKKKKKKKVGTEEAQTTPETAPGSLPPRQFLLGNDNCCLFCEYESIFGTKPRQMIKWYEQKVRRDAQRREDIKKKLANAKSRAIKKQRELRQRQLESQGLSVEHDDSDDSRHEHGHEHEHSHDHEHGNCHEHNHTHSHVS